MTMTATAVELTGDEDLERLEAAPLAFLTFCTQTFKQQNALIEEIAADYGADLPFAFVDILAHPAIAARYAVRGLPVSVILRGGRVVRWLGGTQPKEAYLRAINRELAAWPHWRPRVRAKSGEPAGSTAHDAAAADR
jgi:thioredoxin-like negative regulator of GroEL